MESKLDKNLCLQGSSCILVEVSVNRQVINKIIMDYDTCCEGHNKEMVERNERLFFNKVEINSFLKIRWHSG